MPTDTPDPSLQETTRELLEVLREIERTVEPPDPGRLVRPPTPQGLLEFTSEVGIPAAILVLRTNVAALELLQRSLRMMGEDPEDSSRETPVRDRAATLTATSIGRLDDALSDLQTAVAGRSTDRPREDLLEEARARTQQLESQLSQLETAGATEAGTTTRDANVDVEAELDSLRESVDAEDPDDGTAAAPDS